jgi:hypothetical protein
LEDGPPMFRPGFTSPILLEGTSTHRYRTFTFSGPAFHPVLLVCRVIRVRSPLLTESLLLPFPVATEMFHFATFALWPYAFRPEYPCGWVAPFRNPKITARLPAPLGLSQVPTSFFASGRQDIHRAPLLA